LVNGEIGEWDFRARARKWLFSPGALAPLDRNAGSFRPDYAHIVMTTALELFSLTLQPLPEGCGVRNHVDIECLGAEVVRKSLPECAIPVQDQRTFHLATLSH
jgi:hypothetical protein